MFYSASHIHIMNKDKNNRTLNSEESKLPSFLENPDRYSDTLKVPEGYFESLNMRIVDSLQAAENKSAQSLRPAIFRPVLWVPAVATVIIAMLIIVMVPKTKETVIPAPDEWSELNMAYDATYAEEAILSERFTLDNEIENNTILIESAAMTGNSIPSDEEISAYLKDQEVDIELLTEN